MTKETFLRSKELENIVDEGISILIIGSRLGSKVQKKVVEETKLKDLKVNNWIIC